jgi:hypothetical protein
MHAKAHYAAPVHMNSTGLSKQAHEALGYVASAINTTERAGSFSFAGSVLKPTEGRVSPVPGCT